MFSGSNFEGRCRIQEHKRSIPSYRSEINRGWDDAERKARNNLTNILRTDQGPAGVIYKSCMDVERIEALGNQPLQPWLRYVEAIKEKSALAIAVAQFQKLNMDTFFVYQIGTDPENSTQKVLVVGSGSAEFHTMPDSTYYYDDSPDMQAQRQNFVETVARMLELAGYSIEDAQSRAVAVLEFEKKMVGILDDRQVRNLAAPLPGIRDRGEQISGIASKEKEHCACVFAHCQIFWRTGN